MPVDRQQPDSQAVDKEYELRKDTWVFFWYAYMDGHGFRRGATACAEDPEDEECAKWRIIAGKLLAMADRLPESRWVQGQVVWAMVKGQAPEAAQILVDECAAEEWWCKVLRGFVLAEGGRSLEAEEVFEEALLLMPERDLCDWTDLSALVSPGVWARYEGSSCQDRLHRLEEMWWLADPAWAVPGNDRKAEHYNRMAWAALHDDLLSWSRGPGYISDWLGHTEDHHPTVVRYGMDFLRFDARWGQLCRWPLHAGCYPGCDDPDVARRAREGPYPCCEDVTTDGGMPMGCPYTPDAQTYRVIPEERALLDPFHATEEDWPLVPGGQPENYVPQAGALLPMDAQVAFFERLDSLVATAAVEVPDDPAYGNIPPDSAIFFLGTAHDEPPVSAHAGARDDRWVFRADAPRRRYVVDIETVAPEAVGRFRSGHGLPHDPAAPLRLSDLLLYTPADTMLEESTFPDSLDAALPLMKGGHRWRQGEVMGVFLEVYGSEEGSSYPVGVELEREPGWFTRLAEALGMGGGRPARVEWVESGAKGRFALSFTVALGDTDPGNYTLRVSVRGPGMSPAVVEQKVRIVEGSRGGDS